MTITLSREEIENAIKTHLKNSRNIEAKDAKLEFFETDRVEDVRRNITHVEIYLG